MYQKSRPRTRPPHLASDAPPESRYTQLAASELQKFEFFFLFLTFASPILGAMFLRYSTAAVLGPDAVSWFSTGLFVLATGMRPWAHFVERVTQRTAELHDFVHYPPPLHGVSTEAHEALEKRVVFLEKALDKMKSKVSHTTEDVYEYVDDAVDAVEHAMRKQERKWDRYEGKVKAVEQTVVQLSTQAPSGPATPEKNIRGALTADVHTLKAYLRSVISHTMPAWLTFRTPLYTGTSPKSPSSTHLLSTPRLSGRTISGRSGPSQSSSSPSSQSPTPLETIFEEGPVSSRGHPLLTKPYHLTSALVYRVGYLATMPIRAIARMVLRRY
jgi:ribosome-associated translation inhibitor RaiA